MRPVLTSICVLLLTVPCTARDMAWYGSHEDCVGHRVRPPDEEASSERASRMTFAKHAPAGPEHPAEGFSSSRWRHGDLGNEALAVSDGDERGGLLARGMSVLARAVRFKTSVLGMRMTMEPHVAPAKQKVGLRLVLKP